MCDKLSLLYSLVCGGARTAPDRNNIFAMAKFLRRRRGSTQGSEAFEKYQPERERNNEKV
jgi:hypothetical protein